MRAGLLILLILCGCGKTVPYEGRTVEDLHQQLKESDANRQAQAAMGLSLHGAAARPALPELVGLLRADKPLVRQQAALAIGAIGPEAVEAVEPLTRLLADGEWMVRRQAALALGAIGPAAKSALPTLQRMARTDRETLVKKSAQEALKQVEAR
jgi:HEAT repeat protein